MKHYKNNDETILVVGDSGFISKYLIKELTKKKYNVIGISRKKITPPIDKKSFKHYHCNLSDYNSLDAIFRHEKISRIIDLAGGKGNTDCLSDPEKAVLRDIYGTLNLITLSKKYNAPIIFVSSYLAYSVSKKRKLPFEESMELQPDDFYGALKKEAEEIIKHSDNYIILRLSHIYGYYSSINSLILSMINSALSESKIYIKGSGKQKYDLLHVEDLCNAILLLLKSDIKNQILNVGGNSPISMRELASAIKDVLNKDIKIIHIKNKNFVEFPDHYVSIKKIQKLLNWFPKISIEEGIKGIIKKIQKQHKDFKHIIINN